VEQGADQGARWGSEGLQTRMHNFGSVIVFQHVMEVVETLNDSTLMLIISELPRMYTFVVLI